MSYIQLIPELKPTDLWYILAMTFEEIIDIIAEYTRANSVDLELEYGCSANAYMQSSWMVIKKEERYMRRISQNGNSSSFCERKSLWFSRWNHTR